MKVLIVLLSMSMSGCLACQRHPIACTAIGVVVVTSVALSTNSHRDVRGPERVTSQPVNCSVPGACT